MSTHEAAQTYESAKAIHDFIHRVQELQADGAQINLGKCFVSIKKEEEEGEGELTVQASLFPPTEKRQTRRWRQDFLREEISGCACTLP